MEDWGEWSEPQHFPRGHLMRYRRCNTPGAVYFITVNLAERDRTARVDHLNSLGLAMRKLMGRHRRPFDIDAIVILPDRLSARWTLPVVLRIWPS
jgi:putative transposase